MANIPDQAKRPHMTGEPMTDDIPAFLTWPNLTPDDLDYVSGAGGAILGECVARLADITV